MKKSLIHCYVTRHFYVEEEFEKIKLIELRRQNNRRAKFLTVGGEGEGKAMM